MASGVNNLGLPWHIAAHSYVPKKLVEPKSPFERAHEYHDAVQPVSDVAEAGVDTGHSGQDGERSRERHYVDVQQWLKSHNAAVEMRLKASSGGDSVKTYEQVARNLKL